MCVLKAPPERKWEVTEALTCSSQCRRDTQVVPHPQVPPPCSQHLLGGWTPGSEPGSSFSRSNMEKLEKGHLRDFYLMLSRLSLPLGELHQEPGTLVLWSVPDVANEVSSPLNIPVALFPIWTGHSGRGQRAGWGTNFWIGDCGLFKLPVLELGDCQLSSCQAGVGPLSFLLVCLHAEAVRLIAEVGGAG